MYGLSFTPVIYVQDRYKGASDNGKCYFLQADRLQPICLRFRLRFCILHWDSSNKHFIHVSVLCLYEK